MQQHEIERLETTAKMKLTTVLRTADLFSKGLNQEATVATQTHPIATDVGVEARTPPQHHARHQNQTSATHSDGSSHRRTPDSPPRAEARIRTDDRYPRDVPPRHPSGMHHRPPGVGWQSSSDSSGQSGAVPSIVKQTTPSSIATDTSLPTSSCDKDPITYYRRLQEQIRDGVAQAQQQQKSALTTLKSRFARQLVEDSTSSTPPDGLGRSPPRTDDDASSASISQAIMAPIRSTDERPRPRTAVTP